MSLTTLTRGRRLLSGVTAAALTAGVLAFTPTAAHAADARQVTSGTISWGLKSSFRNYVSALSDGSVTVTAPATDNGTQTVFAQASGTWRDGDSAVRTQGAVRYVGHEDAMDLTLIDPRIVVTGSTAQLVVDAVDSNGNEHDDLAFANINLSGKVSTSADSITITQAPTSITAAGASLLSYNGSPFYSAGTALDPIDASLSLKPLAKVTVSKVTFAPDEKATITVTGSNFDPAAAVGTRAPFAGLPSGVYIAFGRYLDAWRPSDGVPSTNRKNPSGANGNGVAIKWAVPQASFTASSPQQDPNASTYTILNEDGSFTTTIQIDKTWLDDAPGNFGIYTYAGGGPHVAEYETYTPVSFVPAAPTAKNVSTTYAKGATVSVTAPVPGKVTVVGLGEQTATAAGQVLKFSVPKGTTAGTKTYTVRFTPADTGLTAPAATTVTVKIAKRAAYKATVKVNKKPTSRKKGKAKVTVKGVKGAAAPTGKVRIKLVKGKKSKTVTLKLNKKGVATKKLPKLAKGTWKVRVSYLGNANYTKRGFVKAGKIKVTK